MFPERVIGLATINPWQQPPGKYSYPPEQRGKPFDRVTRYLAIEKMPTEILELGLWGHGA